MVLALSLWCSLASCESSVKSPQSSVETSATCALIGFHGGQEAIHWPASLQSNACASLYHSLLLGVNLRPDKEHPPMEGTGASGGPPWLHSG